MVQVSKLASILPKTYRVVLEVFVSLHSNDFWCSNLPGLYVHWNNLTTRRVNIVHHKVVVTVDCHLLARSSCSL
jgi:hypothetical protein